MVSCPVCMKTAGALALASDMHSRGCVLTLSGSVVSGMTETVAPVCKFLDTCSLAALAPRLYVTSVGAVTDSASKLPFLPSSTGVHSLWSGVLDIPIPKLLPGIPGLIWALGALTSASHWYTGTPDCLPGQRRMHVRCCRRGIAILGHRHPSRARKVSPVPGHIWISLHPQIWVLIHHGAWIAPWRCHVTRIPAIDHLPWGWRRAMKWCHWGVLMPRIHRTPAQVRTYRRGYISPPLRLLPLPKLSICIPRLWLPVLRHHTPVSLIHNPRPRPMVPFTRNFRIFKLSYISDVCKQILLAILSLMIYFICLQIPPVSSPFPNLSPFPSGTVLLSFTLIVQGCFINATRWHNYNIIGSPSSLSEWVQPTHSLHKAVKHFHWFSKC